MLFGSQPGSCYLSTGCSHTFLSVTVSQPTCGRVAAGCLDAVSQPTCGRVAAGCLDAVSQPTCGGVAAGCQSVSPPVAG